MDRLHIDEPYMIGRYSGALLICLRQQLKDVGWHMEWSQITVCSWLALIPIER